MKLGQYKGLHVEGLEEPVVSEEEIENFLTKTAESCAYYDEKDGVSEVDDKVVLDIVTFGKDGVIERPFDTDFSYLVGSHKFEAVEDKIVGVKKDDKFSFEMPLITDASEINKEEHEIAKFNCKVLRVERKVIPELTDSFVRSLGFKSKEDLREQVRLGLLGQKQMEIDDIKASRLLVEILNNSEVVVDESKVDEFTDMVRKIRDENLAANNITKEQYLENNNISEEAYEDGIRKTALDFTKSDMIINEIAKRENLVVSKNFLDSQITRYKEDHNLGNATLDDETISAIEVQCLRELVRNFLLENND